MSQPGADPHDLRRFVDAQAPVIAAVQAELDAGAKTSHWMWFVFPQLAALGRSSTAKHYGLSGAAAARAYLAHPLLGERLADCSERVLHAAARGRTAVQIFGSIDAMKLRSSMTLFEAVAPQQPVGVSVYARVIDALYAGERDALTLSLLAAEGSP